jgi:hypothetical protein
VLSRAIEKLGSTSNMIQGRPMACLVLVVASLGMLSCTGLLPESTTPSAVEQQVMLPQPVEEMRDLTIVEKAALADGFALASKIQIP